mmetsp:Transcript_20203/g.44571  ORF Transcript_20203/g.44571 Transcript_20203/m.44571 type:complete len:267 (-) Transcript_20203:197-997(-)
MSRILFDYPHSLSYQDTSLTNWSDIWMPALTSTIELLLSVTKSCETTISSVTPRTFFKSEFERFLSSAMMSAYLAPFWSSTVRSTTDTLAVGTLKAMPVSLPLRLGITLPTALAAPVLLGIMLFSEQRPPLQSLPETESTVFWVPVTACTVVIRPCSMPKVSCNTRARGARQLVVQEAFEKILTSLPRVLWFTPYTNMGVSSLEGALKMTFLAPPSRWPEAPLLSRKTPVHSATSSAPTAPHLMSLGAFSLEILMCLPLSTSESLV